MSVALPPPRNPGSPYAIALVCLGNICRSPTAEVVLTTKLDGIGLGDKVLVSSAGTGDWHVGERMDHRAATTLAAHGYDPTHHRAKTFDSAWFDHYDVVLVMDSSNFRDVGALAQDDAQRKRTLLFRNFDPDAAGELDLPDPWYGGEDGFEEVLSVVERTADALVAELERTV